MPMFSGTILIGGSSNGSSGLIDVNTAQNAFAFQLNTRREWPIFHFDRRYPKNDVSPRCHGITDSISVTDSAAGD
jgi:hypothetical protein